MMNFQDLRFGMTGSETPLWELADSIFSNQTADTRIEKDKDPSTLSNTPCLQSENDWSSVGSVRKECFKRHSSEAPVGKSEASSSKAAPSVKDIEFEKILEWKRPKHEFVDVSSSFIGHTRPEPKAIEPKMTSCQMPSPHKELHQLAKEPLETKPCLRKSIYQMVAKPPYFFYGNVVDICQDSWAKISRFLYAIEPEVVNTQFFSALNRKEGYIHNLPTDNRSYILPKPPMSIEDTNPHIKKWWPSWDTRKQLSCISSETEGISQLCERLGKILIDTQGMLSSEQQRDILHHCKTLNLVWVDKFKLSPIKPEQMERILGYPLNHTQVSKHHVERLQSLKHCFQTDTLGYYLSVLKAIFPDGLTILSLYSGIGGAEIALHRLGIHLKGVVSVEHSETNRRILKNWWHDARQTGKLVQIEDIHRLTGTTLERLFKEFGGFDLVICQNPCTYNTGSSKKAVGNDNPLDFPLFYEFVRVLQQVRSRMGRNK